MHPQLSVTWDSYQKNICNGLNLLQQRGELVDMTLAADGHHVKVHQLVMSLASPYIKQLISSAHSTHPIIFLNCVSYETLQSILEYAYTGEVTVPQERIHEFLEACKKLHIRGLQDKNINTRVVRAPAQADDSMKTKDQIVTEPVTITEPNDNNFSLEDSHTANPDDNEMEVMDVDAVGQKEKHTKDTLPQERVHGNMLQYALSCQGSIQLVLNRYIYRLRHARKHQGKLWRCAEYNRKKCPAYVVTDGDKVIERGCAHDHPFHDRQILRRVREGKLFKRYSVANAHALQHNKETDRQKQHTDRQ